MTRRTGKGKKTAVIYDSNCPICSNAIRWIEQNEARDSFVMVPCQSDEREELFPAVNQAACMQALHLVLPDGTVLKGEKTFPEIVKRLKWFRAVGYLWNIPGMKTVSRVLYQGFAHARYWISEMLNLSLPKDRHS